MKAKRRHELQQNELAKVIKKAPTFWEDWGSRALALAIAVLIVVILVRYRINSNRQAAAAAVGNLAAARTAIEELAHMAMAPPTAPAPAIASERRQFFNDANNAITDAMRESDDRKIQAEALVAKGDLYFTMASLPPIEGAATQPMLMSKDPKELLSGAHEAYTSVVENYADQAFAKIAARFGLAALAENKGDFDAAKTQYEKLAGETNDWPAYQHAAAVRLNALVDLRKPVRIAQPATIPVGVAAPPTAAAPTTIPAALGPAKPQATVPKSPSTTAPATTHPR